MRSSSLFEIMIDWTPCEQKAKEAMKYWVLYI